MAPARGKDKEAIKGKVQNLANVDYWRDLLGDLTVSSVDSTEVWTKEHTSLDGHRGRQGVTTSEIRDLRERILEDGYAQLPPGKVLDHSDENTVSKLGLPLANGIKKLAAAGWPASFIFLSDEAWILAGTIAELMRAVTGNEMSYDMLAWHVDPNQSESGFSPHRDRQPEEASSTFREDGMAKYTTCWVALTDAMPDNSCLYVIPSKFDPGYKNGDKDDVDPMAAALPNKEAYQHIRALPTQAGGALLFTHRIIHWGSSGRKEAENPPRLSLSIGFSDYSYEKPYLRDQQKIGTGAKIPDFKVRLTLVCAQMISYYQRFDFPVELLAAFYKYFSDNSELCDKTYAASTMKEFGKAVMETVGGKPGNAPSKGSDDDWDEDLFDDMWDDALEVILDNEAEGDMDFEDDYDEIEMDESCDSSKKRKQLPS